MHRETGQPYSTSLEAVWSIDFSEEVAQRYPPGQLSIETLFKLWFQEAHHYFFYDWVWIDWFIRCPEVGIIEPAPFQSRYQHHPGKPSFLTKFTYPYDLDTHDRLQWSKVPVAPLMWTPEQWDSSGFIQQATQWRPGLLQPTVDLGWLKQCFSLSQVCEP